MVGIRVLTRTQCGQLVGDVIQGHQVRLIWRNRLLKGNFEQCNRPPELYGSASSFRTGRLCIDVFLDSFRPTSDKKGINFEAEGATEEELIDELIEQLNQPEMPILAQAENYRDEKLPPSVRAICESELISTVQKLHDGATAIMEASERFGPEYAYPPIESLPQLTSDSTVRIEVDGNPWEVTIEFRSSGPNCEWLHILEEPTCAPTPTRVTKLLVALELDHPFNKQYLTEETAAAIVRFAAGFAFSELAATRVGRPNHPVVIRHKLSRFLHDVLVDPPC